MNNKIIIYKQDNGIPAIIIPSEEYLKLYDILEIAKKDVPFGKPFAIADSSDLNDALDYTQESWEIEDSDLKDGIGERK